MPLGTEVGIGPDDNVLDGDPASPSPKGGGAPPQFSAHFYCGQTAGFIKMPLGMEVGLSQGDFGLDWGGGGWGQSPPIFGPWLLWPNGWMDQDDTWHGGRPWPSPHCVR